MEAPFSSFTEPSFRPSLEIPLVYCDTLSLVQEDFILIFYKETLQLIKKDTFEIVPNTVKEVLKESLQNFYTDTLLVTYESSFWTLPPLWRLPPARLYSLSSDCLRL